MEPDPPPVRPARNRIFFNSSGIRSGWRLLVWAFIATISVATLGTVTKILIVASGLSLRQTDTLLYVVVFLAEWVIFAVIFGASAIVATLMEKRPITSLGLAFYPGWANDLLRGTVWGVALMTIVMITITVMGGYRFHGFNEGIAPALGWGSLFAVGFIGLGLFEEFLFRGYLLQNLSDGINVPVAVTVSCLLFAATHVSNSGENAAGIVDVFLAGLMFAVIIIRTGSLWMAVGLHAAWDWSQNFVFGVADSGVKTPGGLLLGNSIGPTWLSGGHVGPEGSLIAIAVNAAAILYFCKKSSLVSRYEEPPTTRPDLQGTFSGNNSME